MAAKEYDVLIIGSGASGGMAAYTLAQKGVKCLLLDAGPQVDFQDRGFKPVYELPYRGFGKPGRLAHVYQANEFNANQWVDETQVPYTHDPKEPYNWVRVRMLGGKSNFWARMSFRLSDYEFKGIAARGATSRRGGDADGVTWIHHVRAPRTGSTLCPSCGMLVGVNDAKCLGCGRAAAGPLRPDRAPAPERTRRPLRADRDVGLRGHVPGQPGHGPFGDRWRRSPLAALAGRREPLRARARAAPSPSSVTGAGGRC